MDALVRADGRGRRGGAIDSWRGSGAQAAAILAARAACVLRANHVRRDFVSGGFYPVMVWLTVIHTVFGALVFASSILVVLLCYRLVPRRGTVAVPSRQQTAAE